jgi:plastocyanin
VKINKRSGGVIVAAIAAAVVAIVFLVGPLTGNAPTPMTQGSLEPMSDAGIATTTTNTTTTTCAANAQHRVAVGGGNLSVSINQFSPSTVQIQPGQSVTFYAPSGSTELHNVLFDLSNGTAISSVELAFILPPGFSPDALQLAPPDNFGEPIIQNISGGRQAIIALNKILFHPSTVDQNGHASYLQERELIQLMEQGRQQGLFLVPSLSANYSMQGTEVVVSSGLILDVLGFAPLEQEQEGQQQAGTAEGQQQQQQQQQQEPAPQGVEEDSRPPAYPILSNFTVTFNEPGAYPFFCAFHPGMTGVVNVIDTNAALSQPGTEIAPA